MAIAAAALTTAPPTAADVDADKAVLRHITQLSGRYHSVVQAEKAGFVADTGCVAESGLGGMGYHYINRARIDRVLNVDEPEILVYATAPNGHRRLAAVEYMVVDADQNLATSGDRPSLDGHPFDGPMPGHAPGMPIHYDLHVWAWEENPLGTFATWNPTITCP